MPTFFDLQKFAATGIAAPDMTAFDKARALAAFGGGKTQTLTDVPPLSFKANGTPLISWSMKGNGSQSGTPTPDNPVMPEFVGVRTENLWINYPNRNVSDVLITSENGVIRFSGVCTESLNVDVLISLPAGEYKLAANPNRNVSSDTNYLINLYKSNVLLFGVQNNRAYDIASGELNSDTSDIRMRIRLQKGVDYTGFEIHPMLNLGSTALPYEPYGYKIPITCAGQTVPVYLGQVQTVRRIKKIDLGTKTWSKTESGNFIASLNDGVVVGNAQVGFAYCSHFIVVSANSYGSTPYSLCVSINSVSSVAINKTGYETLSETEFKDAMNGVYLWYVLATPETGIVNEPLAKIGDYADELHSEDTTVTIPTIKGQNTLTVESELQPSSMTITYFEEV